ncbi:family 20 glycosylhydrolase [Streptacidiphilus sp. PB12-B1b]|uniref:beta-N-acetylhexosaminidase n=1 Tax=Streptacidiphilus sp. PB12-B1b TaxID=2705012 RepID=UPI0015F7E3EC|nr:beta-N-acetylhexosaminidase [Streptacidiphilus sp. PB12-B1b]QMU75377.1 family 20 glycosylhydrolase [Streptacidiphilus sp. PB12-B1b]
MVRKALVAASALLALSLAAAVSGCGASRPGSVSSDSSPAPSSPSDPSSLSAAGTGSGSGPGSGSGAAAGAVAPSGGNAAGAALPLVPEPSAVAATGGPGYPVTPATVLRAEGGPAAGQVAGQLAALLRASTGLTLPVRGAEPPATGPGAAVLGAGLAQAGDGGVVLRLDPAAGTGPEGYRLASGPGGVLVTAVTGAGLFHGVQTLRQLLPAKGPGMVPAVRIADQPRYAVRSAELDVARHFFPVPVVEQTIDLLAEYKFNYLHLHLTDDQGWRIAVPGLPGLTGVGAATEIGGGPGGYYTDADYRAIVAYAAARYITVVPEVDMPAHINAALTAYPALACGGSGAADPRPYTRVGGATDSLCTGSPSSYAFVDQVVAELARLTPGPYLDVGGDEALSVDPADYAAFMTRVSAIARAHGKQPEAWEDAASARGGPALLGVWHPVSQEPAGLPARLAAAVRGGARLLLEPADHAYLDQKYDASTPLGLDWAGYVGVARSYGWDPATLLAGVPSNAVAGVEAAVWTETIATPQQLQTMLLPRLPALAEVGWTPQADRDWSSFRLRLAAQAPRWDAQQLAWTRAPGVPWPAP